MRIGKMKEKQEIGRKEGKERMDEDRGTEERE